MKKDSYREAWEIAFKKKKRNKLTNQGLIE